MTSVLITGANRGIGFGLVKKFLERSDVEKVVATVRNLEGAKELQAIAKNEKRLFVIQMDLTSQNDIKRGYKQIEEILGNDGLDLLINNAGVLYQIPLDSDCDQSVVEDQFKVNSVSPVILTLTLRDVLKRAVAMSGHAQIVNISSALGSIDRVEEYGKNPRSFIYSMSKASLNMFTMKLAVEWSEDNIRCTSISPGWVRTDMGGVDAELTVDESAEALIKTILGLDEKDNGKFYDRNGNTIPW